ncbi:MAG TPA: cytochrome c oxidase subunit 3 [Pseudonocardia sp.]|nr:cytochrome c oxidase subunit 3 [Pseudonocardia sp.]
MSTISETTTAAAERGQRHLPGEEGTWVFILGDMTVFAVFFATYLYYRGQQRALFIESQHSLVQGYGVTNTLLLLTSSLCVVLGMKAVRRRLAGEPTRAAPWLFGGALACGLGFSVMKFVEYGQKLAAGITPATNDFFMYYFILTGLHFFHLILGMGVLVFLIRAGRQASMSARQFAFVEGGACFWHMVDLLWIVLFPLLYLVK